MAPSDFNRGEEGTGGPESEPRQALLSWDEETGGWEPRSGSSPTGPLLVADSWLIADGCVRGWELHMNRFAGSCIAQGASAATLDGLIAALPQALPGAGEWFPRLEMRCGETDLEFHLRLRPAPQRWQVAVAWLADRDPRTAPRVKGPDLDELMQLRATAESHGADEAVIVNGCGELIEAAGCSIAWWEGEVLHLVSASEPILAGVTRRLLHDLAANCEVEVREALLPAADADRHEVWLLNALIGIVPVTDWVGGGEGLPDRLRPAPPIDRPRLAAWRQRLAALAAVPG